MKNYIIMRLLATVPLLLGISFLCFVFINLIPSDPAEVALRIRQTPSLRKNSSPRPVRNWGWISPFWCAMPTGSGTACTSTWA